MTSIDQEQREDRSKDPEAHDAIERLLDAYDQFTDALYIRFTETGLLLRGIRPGPEQLGAAHRRLEAAEAIWARALSGADALLDRRQAIQHSQRFRAVSNRYPRRVAEAYGGDIARAMSESDEEVAATVAAWERARGIEPRDWRAIGAKERREGGE
jgi:hypothetical protein